MTDPWLAPVAEASRALGWALVHFLWQGAAIAAALAMVRLVLPDRAARLRYLSGCAALAAMLAAPVVTFALLHEGAAGEVGVVPTPADTPVAAPVSAAPIESAPLPWLESARAWLDPAIPWVLAIWLAGVSLLSIRLAGGCLAARRLTLRGCEPAAPEWVAALARLCKAVGVSRPVTLTASALAEVPSVVGWLRPVIVMPVSVLSGMTPWQVEAILSHELAHIRRHDYLVNILQSAVETLLFYHPAIWWVSRQVREERERCCDDVAVDLCGDAAGYVRALAELAAMRVAPALAMSATGGSLLGRARRLLAPRDARRPSASVAGAVLVALVACGWATASAERGGHSSAPTMAAFQSLSPSAEPLSRAAPDSPVQLATPLLAAPPVAPRPKVKPPRPPRAAAPADDRDLDDPDLIDVMAQEGYRRIPVEQLISLGTHGVTRDFVRAMNGLGFGRLAVEEIVSLKIHGVTAAYARELRAAGITISSADELRSMRIHGVTAAYARELRAAGVTIKSAEELRSMRIHGVTAAFVREVKRLGYRPLSPERLVELKIHGVILDRRTR